LSGQPYRKLRISLTVSAQLNHRSRQPVVCQKVLAGRQFQLNGLVESRTAVTVGGRQMTGTASAGVQHDVPGGWTVVPTSSISVSMN